MRLIVSVNVIAGAELLQVPPTDRLPLQYSIFFTQLLQTFYYNKTIEDEQRWLRISRFVVVTILGLLGGLLVSIEPRTPVSIPKESIDISLTLT